MSDPKRAQQKRSLLPFAVAGGGVLLVAMVVLLALTLAELRDARTHIESTDAKLTALAGVAAPAARQVTPLAREGRGVIEAAAPLVRTLDNYLPSLRSAGAVIGPSLPRLPAILSSGQELIAETVPVVRSIAASGLAPTLAEARQVFAEFPTSELDTAIQRASGLLDDPALLQLPDRVERAVALLEEVLAVQHQLVGLQERSVKIQSRSLEVQRRTLSHTRSIDDRLGGQLAPPLGTP